MQGSTSSIDHSNAEVTQKIDVTATRLTLAIASSYTFDPLNTYLPMVLENVDIDGEILSAPFGQLFEVLVDPLSVFGQNAHGLNICLLRFADWRCEAREDQRFKRLEAFMSAVEEFTAASSSSLLVCLGPEPNDDLQYVELEKKLFQLNRLEGVCVLRLGDWLESYAIDDIFDVTADRIAHIPYTEAAFACLALGLSRVAKSMVVRPRKVIAVDCDFTLWEGACGDLDANELLLEKRHVIVQEFLKRKYDEGFMLALCSRNDPESVEKVFAAKEGKWPLRREHFVSAQINWLPKWKNLNTIANDLNVGIESLILVDDDPFVCAQTASVLPQVAVVNITPDSDTGILHQHPEFDRFFITREDALRNNSYKADKKRQLLAQSSLSPEELNNRLKTKISVRSSKPEDYRRIEQLFRKTNQFTLAMLRPEQCLARLDHDANSWTVTLEDAFGNYGIVAAAITSSEARVMKVEALAMSCRVLHRGVETALLKRLRNEAEGSGCNTICADALVTARNHLARNFFRDCATVKKIDGDIEHYCIDLNL